MFDFFCFSECISFAFRPCLLIAYDQIERENLLPETFNKRLHSTKVPRLCTSISNTGKAHAHSSSSYSATTG